MISRRRFITGSVIALTPLGATASAQEYKTQQAMKMPRIGALLTLHFSAEDAPLAFGKGLHALGYVAARSAYSAPHLLFL